jgi:hypothetical protein
VVAARWRDFGAVDEQADVAASVGRAARSSFESHTAPIDAESACQARVLVIP